MPHVGCIKLRGKVRAHGRGKGVPNQIERSLIRCIGRVIRHHAKEVGFVIGYAMRIIAGHVIIAVHVFHRLGQVQHLGQVAFSLSRIFNGNAFIGNSRHINTQFLQQGRSAHIGTNLIPVGIRLVVNVFSDSFLGLHQLFIRINDSQVRVCPKILHDLLDFIFLCRVAVGIRHVLAVHPLLVRRKEEYKLHASFRQIIPPENQVFRHHSQFILGQQIGSLIAANRIPVALADIEEPAFFADEHVVTGGTMEQIVFNR